MARQSDLSKLSPAYRHRLESNAARLGVSIENLRANPGLMRAARGHELTPEHPQQAKNFFQRLGITQEQAREIIREKREAKKAATRFRRQTEKQTSKAPREFGGYRLVTSDYLKQFATEKQYAAIPVNKAGVPYTPSVTDAMRMHAPHPSLVLQALDRTDTRDIRIAVLLLSKESPKGGTGRQVSWVSFRANRGQVRHWLSAMVKGWGGLSKSDRHGQYIDLVNALAAGNLAGEVEALIGFSFANSPRRES